MKMITDSCLEWKVKYISVSSPFYIDACSLQAHASFRIPLLWFQHVACLEPSRNHQNIMISSLNLLLSISILTCNGIISFVNALHLLCSFFFVSFTIYVLSMSERNSLCFLDRRKSSSGESDKVFSIFGNKIGVMIIDGCTCNEIRTKYCGKIEYDPSQLIYGWLWSTDHELIFRFY